METSSSSGQGGEGAWTAAGGTGPWTPGVQREAQPLCRELQVQNCSHRVASQSRLEEGMRGQSSGNCGEASQRGLTQWQKVVSTGSCEGQANSQGPHRPISAALITLWSSPALKCSSGTCLVLCGKCPPEKISS